MASRDRKKWQVAAIQLQSTADIERNVKAAERLVRKAAAAGADLVALPENFAYLRPEGKPLAFRDELGGPLYRRMSELAAECGCWFLAGSFPERIPRSRKVYNTSVLFDPKGREASVYRKLHLFDIAISGGTTFKESATVKPGPEPVVASTPLGKLGLSICYDLRFPEMYRYLAGRGARVLFVPAAFTAYTGKAHWLALLRARAIENLCWVVAPAQDGHHGEGRESFGHTVVFDPWGETAGLKRHGAGIVSCTIDLGAVERVRRGLPALRHRRRDLFEG
ncbi:hypothetical protein ABI59_20950 [Acidobacteria bacterium Mor1]|nr:hypothetical protein ABI59_20950 [Acidobacteria bacterium Mor1]